MTMGEENGIRTMKRSALLSGGSPKKVARSLGGFSSCGLPDFFNKLGPRVEVGDTVCGMMSEDGRL